MAGKSLEQQKTADEYHCELIYKIEQQLTDEKFREVKQLLGEAHINPRPLERIKNFSELASELVKIGVIAVGEYSKLNDALTTTKSTKAIELIEEYRKKIKETSGNSCREEKLYD